MTNTVKDSLIGQLVDGRYMVQERVARGGMATVYRAVDKRLGRTVALKVMHAHLAEGTSGQSFVARFRREARAAARVTHSGLVAVYDQGVDGDISYLTLEFVEGSDLRRLLEQKGTLTLAEAIAITEDILDALAAAHRSQLIHRDVKPENVLLSRDNEVKLTDFGLARAVTEVTSTTTGTILGTVAYLAPELVTTGVGDARTDIYAVGIMLYEMVCGKQPFSGDTPIHVAFQHVNAETPSLKDQADWIPAQLDDLIQTFTHKQPAERPADASAALALLKSVRRSLKPGLLSKRLKPPALQSATSDHATAESARDEFINITDIDTEGMRAIEEETDGASSSGEQDAVLVEHDSSGKNLQKVTPSKPVPHEDLEDLITATSPHETVPLEVRSPGTTIALPLGAEGIDALEKKTAQNAVVPVKTQGKPKKKRRKGKVAALTILLVALLGGAGYGGWYWYSEIGPGSFTVVPSKISSVSKADAERRFQDQPLTPVFEEDFSDIVPQGQVISAEPSSGERVKKDSKVTLVVSKGIQEFTVPESLTGKDYSDVKSLLEDAGFKEVKETLVYDTKVKKNTVMQLSVKEGAVLPHNTAIELTVSNGPEPITIPQVLEKSKSEALSILESYELTVKSKEAFSDTIAEGDVISQKPEQGTSGHRGDKITIVVSKGPELITVPNVKGKKTAEATKILEDLGFEVKTNLYLDGFFGLVRFQDVKGGEQVPKGSVISLTVF